MRVFADLVTWIEQGASSQSFRRSGDNSPEFSLTQELFCRQAVPEVLRDIVSAFSRLYRSFGMRSV